MGLQRVRLDLVTKHGESKKKKNHLLSGIRETERMKRQIIYFF